VKRSAIFDVDGPAWIDHPYHALIHSSIGVVAANCASSRCWV
jgi:hypothetical protein